MFQFVNFNTKPMSVGMFSKNGYLVNINNSNPKNVVFEFVEIQSQANGILFQDEINDLLLLQTLACTHNVPILSVALMEFVEYTSEQAKLSYRLEYNKFSNEQPPSVKKKKHE